MMEFVIILGVVGGWVILISTLAVMLLFGKMWGLLGIVLLVIGIEVNKRLKRKYMSVIVDYSPNAKALARHIFEMNELIMISSYVATLFIYMAVQQYVQVVVKIPHVGNISHMFNSTYNR